MEAIYEKGVPMTPVNSSDAADAPSDEAKEKEDKSEPPRITPKETLIEPSVYNCEKCLQPSFTPEPEVVERLRMAAKQRQCTKAATGSDSRQSPDVGKKSIMGGAQLLASATDRARQLGLIGAGSSRGSVCSADLVSRSFFSTVSCLLTILHRS